MIRNGEISRAVHRALMMSAVAAAGASLPLHAQDQDQTSSVETVTVTGSRIPLPNLTSISPVTSISSEEIKMQGTTRVEDLINNLPQAFADYGGNLSNGATGAATIDLRNLGSERTLVLINGRRLMPGDPTQNGAASADVNQIPGALVERVEILTGGASAVYGADAIAGVVNFIMNDNFEGLRFEGQYSFYQHNNDNAINDIVDAKGYQTPDSNVRDGYARDFTITAGINSPDGKGNATVYVGYRQMDSLSQDQRDFSACSLNSGDEFTCGGSGTTAPARFVTPTGGNFILGDGNVLRPYTSADAYNFAPTNYYQRPDERKTAGLFAHYDINEHSQVYTEFMFMDDRTIAQIAPSGAFLGGGPGAPPFFGNNLINCDNPLLSASQVTAFCGNPGNLAPNGDALVNIGRRNVEGGPRIDDLRHTSYRAVVGSKGEIVPGWTYDAYGLYGETVYSENYRNDFSRTRLGKALNAVRDPSGNIVCRVNADADLSNNDPNCVPYNIFQLGGVTQDQLNYLQVPGFQSGGTIEQVASLVVAGDLGQHGFKLPGATDGLGVVFGAEYRQEESELRADAAFQTNDLAGQGAPTLDTFGQFSVKELFTEARLPILQDKAWAKVLSVEAGYRYSDYSLDFDTDTYKFGADWAPADAFRVRASFQRAVRSPNIQELFLQNRVQLDGSTDPCASEELGDTPEASLAQCLLTGITPAQYGQILANPAAQYNGLVGGNPNLDPESSDTVSFGFVLTPGFAPGLSVAIDYYNIKVEHVIDDLGADFVLNNCLTTGDEFYCGLVNRAPNGSLWLGDGGYIENPTLNKGSLETTGIDVDAAYRFDMGSLGRLAFSFIGTYTDEYITEPLPGSDTYDCAGLYGTVCEVPIPEWRHKARATWTTPYDFDLTVSWRFIQAVDLDSTSSNPQLAGDVPVTDAKLNARNYIDLSGSYQWNNLTARLGVNNVFDKDPPVLGASNLPPVFGNGNTFPQVYDTLGRYIFLGLQADF